MISDYEQPESKCQTREAENEELRRCLPMIVELANELEALKKAVRWFFSDIPGVRAGLLSFRQSDELDHAMLLVRIIEEANP